jgi:short-subunit dehydrogenase
MNFKDKVVLVSGATGGMAQEIIKIIAKEKGKLAIFARREDKLKEISKKLAKNKLECIYQKCDVSKPEDVKKAVELTKKKFGRIDVAILTAGILVPIPIQTFNSKLIRESMEINFMGNVYFIEQLLPIMKEQKSGKMAVISTLPDKRGVPGWSTYGASKAALSWLLESLRAEAKQLYNIDIITVKPGSVLTPMIEDFHRQGAISSEHAAKAIVTGIKKGKKVVEFPTLEVLLIKLKNLMPVFAYDMFPVDEAKGEGFPEIDENALLVIDDDLRDVGTSVEKTTDKIKKIYEEEQ